MRHLIELSGESEELARAEALALSRTFDSNSSLIKSDTRLAIIEGNFDTSEFAERLALGWSASHHVFSGTEDDLMSTIESIELPGKTFRVKTKRLGYKTPEEGQLLSKKVGQIIARRYKVNLDNPEVELRILMTGKIHAGILAKEIDRSSFEARKSENRPFSHPYRCIQNWQGPW